MESVQDYKDLVGGIHYQDDNEEGYLQWMIDNGRDPIGYFMSHCFGSAFTYPQSWTRLHRDAHQANIVGPDHSVECGLCGETVRKSDAEYDGDYDDAGYYVGDWCCNACIEIEENS